MLIQKDGITRDIDEDRLHEYTAKGYAPVQAEKPKEPPKKPAAKE